MKELKNKVCVITGGSRGIGKSICELFAKEGALVIAASRTKTCFENKTIDYCFVDVVDENSCQNLVDYVMTKYGRIDVLICNAGKTNDSLMKNMTRNQFIDVINTNLVGVFNIINKSTPIFEKQRIGNIITIASVVAKNGNIGQANYVASKSGLIGLTKTLAKEFSRKEMKIRVNAISPGFTETEMINKISEELLAKFKQKIMLGRFAKPNEIAQVALFLASDKSSYITGTNIEVDGGLIL